LVHTPRLTGPTLGGKTAWGKTQAGVVRGTFCKIRENTEPPRRPHRRGNRWEEGELVGKALIYRDEEGTKKPQ